MGEGRELRVVLRSVWEAREEVTEHIGCNAKDENQKPLPPIDTPFWQLVVGGSLWKRARIVAWQTQTSNQLKSHLNHQTKPKTLKNHPSPIYTKPWPISSPINPAAGHVRIGGPCRHLERRQVLSPHLEAIGVVAVPSSDYLQLLLATRGSNLLRAQADRRRPFPSLLRTLATACHPAIVTSHPIAT